MDAPQDDVATRRQHTAEIVAAYVSNNHVPRDELASLIGSVFEALNFQAASQPAAAEAPALVPAVPIKKSATPDYLICLEDGKKFKSLKRHLMTDFGLTPEAYRQKWGLPADYPMVATAYAAKRSELARKMGLGRKPAAAAEMVEAADADEPEVAEAAPASQEKAAPKRRSSRKAKAEAA
ncbi:Predicted transcriptional regulator [Aureimonas jatrophae]|jgi:predicted transcriptional regulator|uniref:Predicted transcriptional regulator n=2 Tax=Aureimonas jatrophae TaxID=1166073 RepID=A0A1H0HQJ2_9HYPH|nr:MucR family transcriptional regulator [Aureimonas jatrophae]SDO21081.1 Predicted transcriptional regulator [Aureimonas jatrophae]